MPANRIQGRLRWQCRRSCREIDLLLNDFLDHPAGYARLSPAAARVFADLLQQPDAVLLDWLLGGQIPEDPQVREVVACILSSALP